jgi:hypothetical protein
MFRTNHLAAAAAAALLVSGGVAAQSSDSTISVAEAVYCIGLDTQIDASDDTQRAWASAMDRWSSGIQSNGERDRYNAMVERFNRANDANRAELQRYNSRCIGVSISRATFDQVCGRVDSDFCDGFSFN